jgi:Tfp pilus assembly protein PilN
VVLGALALCVVALVGYVLTGNAIAERKTELASVTAQHEAAAREAAALKPYATFQELATQRVGTVTALAQTRFDWERALRDVSQALPSDVTLETLKGSVTSAGGTGGVRGAVSAPAIEIAGCTAKQRDVASLMSRLRTVRGVTRVSLAKSVEPEAGATASTVATAPGGAPSGMPCGRADAPKFEIVAFFERSVAAASASTTTPGTAPASGTAAAAATGAPAGSAGSGTTPAGTTAPSATATPSSGSTQPPATGTTQTASTAQGTTAP